MFKAHGLFWFLSFLISTEQIGFPPRHHEEREEKVFPTRNRRSLTEQWIYQPLDHFNLKNRATWLMRFYENGKFFDKTGPIFIMIGGEWAINSYYVEAGFMYENAKRHGAMMYYVEHRYYGKSHPVPDLAYESLMYLNTKQALADIAFFIEIKKKELDTPDAFVIVFGGSYAGNLAAWMRALYPQLVQGAIASNAPVYAKADFPEYYEAVATVLRNYDERCAKNTQEAFSTVGKLLSGSRSDLQKLENDFNLCKVTSTYLAADRAFVLHGFASIFRDAVQQNSVESNERGSIANLCELMMKNGDYKSPYYNLAEAYRKKYKNFPCIPLKYANFVENHHVTAWESDTAQMRVWFYQICTELGYHQTSSPKSIFGSLFSLKYFMEMCQYLLGNRYRTEILEESIKQMNSVYNSKLPRVKNIIFINGDLDPWHPLSVLSDLNADSPSILIKGTSHWEFLESEKQRDVDSLKNARRRVSSIISRWLNSPEPIAN